jgi:serine/threonine protein kinase
VTEAGPRSFGKYLLEREIARGGMARVHLATLRGLGGFEKRLVVKEILPELAKDPKFVAMFVEEAKVLVALSHPNIVPVYELGIVDGTYFLAMEHVDGATLADLVTERTLAPAEAARVGGEIADALAYAHERFEIVHRDVSPRNVMVDTAGHARLLDFGIAARADVGEGDALYGTPGFLSPEQARGEKLSPASDLFSLGCVLAFATRGASPFGPKELDWLRALDAAPVVEIAGAPELARIVRELLAPRPADRPASARIVARRLAAAATNLEHDEESAFATLVARVSEHEPAASEPASSDTEPKAPVTPGRVETLAKSQALDAILGTAKIVHPPIAESETTSPGTARIERAKPEATVPLATAAPASEPRSPLAAIALSIVTAALAAGLVWNARFELGPTPPIDPIDHGLTSPADIEPLAIEPEDGDVADASSEDAGVREDAGMGETGDVGVSGRARDTGTAPRGTGTLVVGASPWAYVSLDGHRLGTTLVVRRIAVSAGTAHVIRFENDVLGREVERTVRVEMDQSVRLIADFEVDPPTIRGP